ncbi:hypothetical protein NCER_101268 [Vairimorpha ceranae BRL01]|uniref:Uncharacterized protein n=2 Tax=Vairimorpha ceranae TaxID=40302 RepID=C4V9L7_VAIC1|nr:rnase p rnase mrp subunit p30-like protein [Vairimorpha ceranae]EEQ82082.1 hypothetical protein NCER_101268 [Vairimorpha ceranae BRL01]KAF5140020.1 hypothetical protein G9O61_00g017450 [Vairimorpha ceranae]KKO75365.1 rnase p rnase mrp subunit p30-like protein [Vairimorpha ceranae]
MFYDLNINYKYNLDDLDELEHSKFAGFCINKVISQRNINSFTNFALPFHLPSKKIFKKITVELEDKNYNTKSLLTKCDILALKVLDFDNPVDENMCDVITFDCKKVVKFKNINPELFYEINIVDSLYNKKDRMAWMYNVRELIKVTKCKNIVVGTSASHFTEVKEPLDVIKMFSIFGIGDDKCKKILENNARCLEKCAYKRFVSDNCVFNDIPEGSLKEEFILKKFESANKSYK